MLHWQTFLNFCAELGTIGLGRAIRGVPKQSAPKQNIEKELNDQWVHSL